MKSSPESRQSKAAPGSLRDRIRNPERPVRVILVALVYASIGGLTGALLAVFVSGPGLLIAIGAIIGSAAGVWLEGFSEMSDRRSSDRAVGDRNHDN